MATNTSSTEASIEQIQYANVLEKGMYAGLLLMVITFALYVFGVMKPVIPLGDIPTMWTMKSGDYLTKVETQYLPPGHSLTAKVQAQAAAAHGEAGGHAQHVIAGWAWASLLSYGDFLNFLPVAILAGITILCYGVIIPGLMARGDLAMAIMAAIEIVILITAASGILKVGGH